MYRASLGSRWFCRAALLALSALVGCTAGNDPGPTASPRQHPTLEGVPLPSGFRLVDDHSVGRASGPIRVGKFEFVGDTERAAVARFYKEYMPSGGWKLLQEEFDRGVYDLQFESQAEECRVRIKPEAARRTSIVVSIGPRPKGSAERDAPIPVRRVPEPR